MSKTNEWNKIETKHKTKIMITAWTIKKQEIIRSVVKENPNKNQPHSVEAENYYKKRGVWNCKKIKKNKNNTKKEN